jgi:hypothetical protein
MNKAGTGRRTLLQQGLALLGGGAAIAAGARWSRGTQAEAAPAGTAPRTLYARIRPIPGALHANGQAETRLVASGDLLDAPNGKRVGEVSTSCFCLGTPFGPHVTAASNVEMQVLQLHDGTIFGMSAPGAAPGGPKVHAIVGGTAKYAAARGSYVQRPAAAHGQGHDFVEFVVTIAD